MEQRFYNTEIEDTKGSVMDVWAQIAWINAYSPLTFSDNATEDITEANYILDNEDDVLSEEEVYIEHLYSDYEDEDYGVDDTNLYDFIGYACDYTNPT